MKIIMIIIIEKNKNENMNKNKNKVKMHDQWKMIRINFLKTMHGNVGVRHVGFRSGPPKVAMHARLERENGS